MFQEGCRHLRNVSETPAGNDKHGSGIRPLFEPPLLLAVMDQVVCAKQAELFEIIRRVEPLLVEGVLPDDGVEEIASCGHMAARGHAGVAFGIHEPAAVWRRRY